MTLLQEECTFPSVQADPGHDAGTPAGNAGTPADDVLLQKLTRLWDTHRRRGLVVRHKMGRLMNERFGPPTQRQKRGANTLRGYSKALGVSEADVSRMRWFAEHFGTVEDLKSAHPIVSTWTQVKVLLASLRQPGTGGSDRAKGDRRKPRRGRPLHRVIRAVRAVHECASGVDLTTEPVDAERADLKKAVEQMLEVVGRCLGVEYGPVAAARPAGFAPPLALAPDWVAGEAMLAQASRA